MLLSEIFKQQPDENIVRIINERSFDRFSRTTSISEGNLCVYVSNEHFLNTVPINATMIITNEELASKIADGNRGICISKSPKVSFFRCLNASITFNNSDLKQTIIGKGCNISNNAVIAPCNVKIGNNVIIEDYVVIYPNVEIGSNSVIRAGAKIGVQDYNYYNDNGKWVQMNHFGSLIIGQDVDIGYGTVVGIGLYPSDATLIDDNTKIGHLSVIGHDDHIGKNVLIYDGCKFGGYVTIGDNAHITLNSTIRNGIKIGSNTQIDMGSVVIRDVLDNQQVFGNPARRIITPNSSFAN